MRTLVDAGAVVSPTIKTFARERATYDLCQEILPLLVGHYNEVAHFQDIELKPDFDQYIKVDEAGMLRVFTAREAGELIGYAIFFVRANIHYSESLQANQDILYIDPRKRGFGKDFICWCDDQLRDEGVEVVYHHVKVAPKLNFGPLLEKLGYTLIDQIYGRRL